MSTQCAQLLVMQDAHSSVVVWHRLCQRICLHCATSGALHKLPCGLSSARVVLSKECSLHPSAVHARSDSFMHDNDCSGTRPAQRHEACADRSGQADSSLSVLAPQQLESRPQSPLRGVMAAWRGAFQQRFLWPASVLRRDILESDGRRVNFEQSVRQASARLSARGFTASEASALTANIHTWLQFAS